MPNRILCQMVANIFCAHGKGQLWPYSSVAGYLVMNSMHESKPDITQQKHKLNEDTISTSDN